jgi:Domain of unknown function (DUF4157)
MMHVFDEMGDFVGHRHTRLPETGRPLPAGLRWALEMLSGYDLSEVRVYYASAVPAQVGARALTRGTDIHMRAGAEDALAHEAWHVVQQMQGRVEATVDVNGVAVNDDPALEEEADAMGAMAAALSWSGMWRRAQGMLEKVRIKKPVVQRHVLVSGNRYEAVADQDRMAKGFRDFLKDIDQNTSLSNDEIPDIDTIAIDLIVENREFTNWIALAKELQIRNVGYAVEATMRRMYESNKALDEEYKERVASGKDSAEVLNTLDDKILRWHPPTHPAYSYRENQLLRWLLGERVEEPKLLNCWECVLMALVKTAPGNVTKNYFSWACKRVGGKTSLLFASRLIAIMDYYLPRYTSDVIDASKELFRPKDDALFRYDLPAPDKFVIPRGRVILFGVGVEHVAISTGKPVRIATEEYHGVFKRTMGHGILDLNGAENTIRERTIEDCILATETMGQACNNELIIAPFPICNETEEIEMTGLTPPTQEELEKRRKEVDEEATKAYERQAAKLKSDFESSKKRSPDKAAAYEKVYKTKLSTAKQTFERAVLKAWEKQYKVKLSSIDKITVPPKEEKLVLRYGPADPYDGDVKF